MSAVALPASASASSDAIVHKFGGSSLADATCIRQVATLLQSRNDATQVVVVSAMAGVTDALLGLTDAVAAATEWRLNCDRLQDLHATAARELLGKRAATTLDWLAAQFRNLVEQLHQLAVCTGSRHADIERISGLGEVLSAHLLHAFLGGTDNGYALLDARQVLVVQHSELGAAVDWAATTALLIAWRAQHPQARVIITGFIARDSHGRPTTLGRNGSDYSSAIFANLWPAQELHIWTDVDGMLTADPRVAPEAMVIPAMSYHEACELAYFGATVIHPQTLAPAIARGLPIRIRNTFNPTHPGTRIDAHGAAAGPVKGLTLANGLALLNVEGAGMIGVPGTAERVFAALHAAHVSVVMISQGSSEHSICCVVRAAQADTARAAVADAFAHELAAGQINGVQIASGISVLAAVGERMAGTPGVAARLFDALARTRVNIRAIAQGASERNISVAIGADDATRALRAAHAAFYLSPQTLSLGVIGPGKVGAALLDQIAAATMRLKRDANLDLRIRAVASSRSMWLDNGGDNARWRDRPLDANVGCDLDAFANHVHAAHLPHAVIIDCSASDAIAAHYADWLGAGIHVITPNKHAGAGAIERYRAIRAAAVAGGARFRYEATVGAGLPIIQTLRDLLDSGDELHAVEGIFSGTLAWLFNRYDGTIAFSTLLQEAQDKGYTEPDPRDDLSGIDVARKLVILAREAGRELSLEDISLENLVPPALRNLDREAFMRAAHELDASMAGRHAQAAAADKVLRYVARLDGDGNAHVELAQLPHDHAFAHIRLTDNIVQFSTQRYRDNPLVVQGPGAGPEVTAAGVFADLLRVAASLGARV